MSRSKWMDVGTVLKMNAVNYPDKLGWQDTAREFTYKEWNDRANRVANGLNDMAVRFKDTFAVISYNRGEWMDILRVVPSAR
jgi:acyl-CoA synthetase (AMP-forming)/AMP-acid ligase II